MVISAREKRREKEKGERRIVYGGGGRGKNLISNPE